MLRALLTGIGLVAVTTGLFAGITGTSGMPGENAASANVESELRYFAAFWVAYGVVALWLAPRAAQAQTAVRALAGFMFLGGIARAIAWIDSGRPDDLFVALLVLELAIPPLVIALQVRAMRTRVSSVDG